MALPVTYISLLDVPFVQQGLMHAYDLLQACEDADPALVTDEIAETANAFRTWLDEAR